MNTILLTSILALLLFAVFEMTATWAVAQRLRNYGVVDVVWSAGFAPMALLLLWRASDGLRTVPATPFIVLTGMVVLWSLRLGLHLFVRVAGHHPVEDVRYARLRSLWGDAAAKKMFGFYQIQGVLQVLLALPFLLTGHDTTRTELGISGMAGAVLWCAGILGESLSDHQLSVFRKNPANRGKVCQHGLWKWSRHPNYFFEWLVWVGYAVFALGSAHGWIAFLSPALMLHFLLNVTGIPMTEELSVKSKGDAYRAYQKTTSAFFPWFPRRVSP